MKTGFSFSLWSPNFFWYRKLINVAIKKNQFHAVEAALEIITRWFLEVLENQFVLWWLNAITPVKGADTKAIVPESKNSG